MKLNIKWKIACGISILGILIFLVTAYYTMEKGRDHREKNGEAMVSRQEISEVKSNTESQTSAEMRGKIGSQSETESRLKPESQSESQASSGTEAESNTESNAEDEVSTWLNPEVLNLPSRRVVSEVYQGNIKEDRRSMDLSRVDITVGDHLYMTQINDWFLNFEEYEGKTVEIEGYYLNFGNEYTFVGRKGPACPYCTGGYVDFEFKGDQDLSSLSSEETWIRVKGPLREGKTTYGDGSETVFYYIEALELDVLEKPGLDTVKD